MKTPKVGYKRGRSSIRQSMRKSKKISKKRKREKETQHIVFKNKDTPILNSVIEYAHNNKKSYPKLLSALKPLENFVGALDLKESLARQIQYSIVTFTKPSVRRSKRIRRRLDSQEEEDEESDTESDTSDSDYVEGSEDDLDEVQTQMIKKKFIEMLFSIKSDSDTDESDEENEQVSNSLNVMHTLLLGPPGTGKTTFASILVNVWDALKIIKRDKYIITQRSDWIGKYQGHSVQNAKKIISRAKGGVVFIDEAYSLIASNDNDMYGHEVLTTIVEAMTNPSKRVIFIFAGYEKECKRLFDSNAGLRRRFGYTYTFKRPTPEMLVEIMKLQCKQKKWKLDTSKDVAQIFRAQKDLMLDAGGSTEKLVHYAMQAAVSASFPHKPKQTITCENIKEGIKIYKTTNAATQRPVPQHMYL